MDRSHPEPATITLYYEYEADGAKVSTLTMRPPRARDSRDAQRGGGGDGEAELRLLANLCEVTPGFITELHMADYIQVQNAYRGFLEPPLP